MNIHDKPEKLTINPFRVREESFKDADIVDLLFSNLKLPRKNNKTVTVIQKDKI